MFFVLAAFGCLVLDRDARAPALAARDGERARSEPPGPGRPPGVQLAGSVPWWRLAAGGPARRRAAAVKWSAVLFVPAVRRCWCSSGRSASAAPAGSPPVAGRFLDEIGWLALCGVLIVVMYLATWTGWFLTDDGWNRH